ncbi:hypothetical protein SK128_002916, partial [Halocaridina rubra]
MAEGGWGNTGRGSGMRHHVPPPGVGYMTHPPPPPFHIFQVPNHPPPPMNGYMQPPISYNEIYRNPPPGAQWGYPPSFVVPARTQNLEKNCTTYNSNMPVQSTTTIDVSSSYNANIEENKYAAIYTPNTERTATQTTNFLHNNMRRTNLPETGNVSANFTPNSGRPIAQDTFSGDVGYETVSNGTYNKQRGGGMVRGRIGRGRRGGRRRPYGLERGGGVVGSSGYLGRQEVEDFGDSDEQKRAGRDSALAETAAFMRNLNIGSGNTTTQDNSENSNVDFQDRGVGYYATKIRGGGGRRPYRGRGANWGQQRDCYGEDKLGKEWKNRQVRTEEVNEQGVKKSLAKPIKEQNGGAPENKLWADIKPKSTEEPEEAIISRSEGLIEQLTRGTYECMVCCDRIKQQQAIWSCPNCYNCFHLGCIKKWARTSTG